ncbi:MAG: hypothetical protein CENE_00249 [Candidatus Celerinatantimonas neptuna]|nr:MAG: hypothetical protein CENE_00249 [Candidatus Celerinatantimonas neptuna]
MVLYGSNNGQLMTYSSLLVIILTPVILCLKNHSAINNISFAKLFLASSFGIMMISKSIPYQYLAWLFLTIAEIILVTKQGVYIANNSPSSHRGRISGVLSTIQGTGLMPASLITGALIQCYG